MNRSAIETIMGAVVLVVAGLFLFFAYSSSRLEAGDGYQVVARFNRVDGLAVGSDVRMSGIKIGTVASQRIDPKSYRAVVELDLQSDIRLPADTSARVLSDGLLGNAYVLLEPGGAEETLEQGGEIEYTQDAVNLVDLLGRFIFSAADKGKTGSGSDGAGSTVAPEPAPQ